MMSLEGVCHLQDFDDFEYDFLVVSSWSNMELKLFSKLFVPFRHGPFLRQVV